MSNAILELVDLELGYGQQPIVVDINLTIYEGEFVSLLGPSGCGKTTILRAIAGFLPTLHGKILLNGKDISRLPAEQRDVGIVFQNYALFPTMTAYENIAFGLRANGYAKAVIAEKIQAIAEVSGIAAHLNKKPMDLSGGQQQRVAIARAMVMGSRVLLFDEPLSNLDAQVRITMRREIKRLQKELGFTAVFVTHDQEEALSMSDRVLVLKDGKTQQIGTPQSLYFRPTSPFVASFLGEANELSPGLAKQLLAVEDSRVFVKFEDVLLGDDGLPAQVVNTEFQGSQTRVDLDLAGDTLAALVFGEDAPQVGSQVLVSVRPNSAHAFEQFNQ